MRSARHRIIDGGRLPESLEQAEAELKGARAFLRSLPPQYTPAGRKWARAMREHYRCRIRKLLEYLDTNPD